jgi:CRP-like cAMP-binding protein
MSPHYPAPLDTLSEDEYAVLDAYITEHHFPTGQCIFEVGSDGDCCYIIDQGSVRIEIRDHHADDDQVLDFVEPGNILGEQSLLDRQPRSASAYAHRDVVARRIDSTAIDDLMASHPMVALKIISALGRSASLKLRQQAARLDNLLYEQRDPEVDAMIDRALKAQGEIQDWPEERLDALLGALAQAVAAQAQELAAATVAETRVGNVADKTLKNTIASLGVYQSITGRPGQGQLAFDEQRGIVELASPVGVVFGLIPVTNPVATFIFKVLVCLKGRNAVILSPSRLALGVSNQVGALLHEVMRAPDAARRHDPGDRRSGAGQGRV